MRKIILVLVGILIIAGIIYTLNIKASDRNGLSKTPLVVNDSVDTLLQSLESELKKYRPEILQSLNPGINDDELNQAEIMLGQAIHPEMQALYRWHNGLANDEELFPGHGFWSLEKAIQMNRELSAKYKEKGVGFLMAHEQTWLILFPDPAGDGYYYDSKHDYETGGVFYNFREDGYYQYFPSVKNLLQAIVECYQTGAYPPDGEPNFELQEQIMNKYGFEIHD